MGSEPRSPFAASKRLHTFRLNFEHKVLLRALLVWLPTFILVTILLWRGDFSHLTRWTTVLALIAWALATAVSVKTLVLRPLQTLSNMLAAMREEDYSVKARGGGHIVNLATSAAQRWDAKGYGVYAAAKQAIRLLSRTAAHEWALDNIRVNTVAPLSMSPALKDWMAADPVGTKAFLDTVPSNHIGDPELDIGRAVVFLCGPDSRYVTGVTLPLDGGQANFG